MNFDSEEYQSLVPNLSPLANYQSNLNYASNERESQSRLRSPRHYQISTLNAVESDRGSRCSLESGDLEPCKSTSSHLRKGPN